MKLIIDLETVAGGRVRVTARPAMPRLMDQRAYDGYEEAVSYNAPIFIGYAADEGAAIALLGAEPAVVALVKEHEAAILLESQAVQQRVAEQRAQEDEARRAALVEAAVASVV